MTKHVLVNPNTNKLPAGIAEADVHSAITKSGYPLQNIVADYCEKAGFRAIEEWSYLDKDAEQLRTIDVKAEKPLFNYQKESGAKIRPSLVLLIECKQSELPYVFFLSRHPIHVSHFPVFAGLRHREIAIKTEDDFSTFNVGILGALGLESHSFLTREGKVNRTRISPMGAHRQA
jgi:hypothetical protein